MKVENYPWHQLVLGAYVYHPEFGQARVEARHPQDPMRLRLLDGGGNVHDVRQAPDFAVTAWVPSPQDAERILAAKIRFTELEQRMVVDPFPLGTPPAHAGPRRPT